MILDRLRDEPRFAGSRFAPGDCWWGQGGCDCACCEGAPPVYYYYTLPRITVPCCPDVSLPTTLTLVLTPVVGPACPNGGTYTLTWNPATLKWEGTLSCGDAIAFWCNTPARGIDGFRLATAGRGSEGISSTGCNPFHWKLHTIEIGTALWCNNLVPPSVCYVDCDVTE